MYFLIKNAQNSNSCKTCNQPRRLALRAQGYLPCRDYVIGNPFNAPVKIESPIYSLVDIEEMKKLGLILEPVHAYDRLVDKLNKVKAIIQSIP
jgi:hypothetical protein